MKPRFLTAILLFLLSISAGNGSNIGLDARAPLLLGAEETATTQLSALAEKLISLLEKREGESFWASVTRLEELGKDALPSLRARLSTGGEKTRLGCAKALLEVGELEHRKEALAALADLAKNATSRPVQIGAIQIFGLMEDPDVVLPILEALFEKTLDPQVTIPLARTLWEVDHVTPARDRLVELLKSRDLEVRVDAALTLAEVGYFEGEVREILRTLRKEPTARGRRAAALDRVMRLSRQEDDRLNQGRLLLQGTDPAKLLQIKEQRIRELEDQVERIQGGGADAVSAPVRSGSKANRLLEEVVELIQKAYVDEKKTDREQLVLRAVKGMVRSLDEHSLFMEPQESRDFRQVLRGQYAGIGAQVSKPPKGPLEILRPFYSGPAHEAGIRSGDQITEVDGVPTTDLKIDELVDLLKGAENTLVTLKVWRRGWTEAREFEIKRRIIAVPSVYHETLPGDIGYLRLTQFGDRSAEEFKNGLERLEAGVIQGLIIDLRGNSGGLLNAAVRITDLFVDGELPIVSLKGRAQGGEGEEDRYPSGDARKGYPIAVLVNQLSASASEVVAGALKDHGRAILVGQRTYGKGSVQKILPLNSRAGSKLKLTVQYYFLPLGKRIHTERDERGRVVRQGGVVPDVVVESPKLPASRLEQRILLRSNPLILSYADRHWEDLKSLVPYGDLGDHARYPEFAELYKSLDTEALEDDVRAVVRNILQRRTEDSRGREIPFNFQEDEVLQRGILELLARLDLNAEDYPEYRWLEATEGK